MNKEPLTTCQVCGRTIKAGNGLIAHHGYKRPYGWGEQTASCQGARYLPYEISCDRLKEIAEQVTAFLARQETELTALLENPPETLIKYEKRGSFGQEEKCTYTKPAGFDPTRYSGIPRTYENTYAERKYDYERTIKAVKADLASMRKRLADWKPANIEINTMQENNMNTNYSENAGYIAQHKFENSDIVIYNAAEQGVDVNGKYAVVCETHNCLVGATSIPKAREIMKNPDFCEQCMPEAFEE